MIYLIFSCSFIDSFIYYSDINQARLLFQLMLEFLSNCISGSACAILVSPILFLHIWIISPKSGVGDGVRFELIFIQDHFLILPDDCIFIVIKYVTM